MELIIRNTDSQPIYEQIAAQLRRQILSGALAPGEALPSIRGLAKDLKISVITTKRATMNWRPRALSTPWPERAALWRSKIWSWYGRSSSSSYRPGWPRPWSWAGAAA